MKMNTSPPPLARLAALLMLAAMLAPAAVNAQTVGQSACPDGVTQKGEPFLSVTDVKASQGRIGGTFGFDLRSGYTQATLGGGAHSISPRDIEALTEITGAWLSLPGFTHADVQFAVRDAAGDLVHGVWHGAGTVGFRDGVRDLTIQSPVTILSLEPSAKHVAQLVVGELRYIARSRVRVVTDDVVSGVGNPNKPKPVLAQVCFQTPAAIDG